MVDSVPPTSLDLGRAAYELRFPIRARHGDAPEWGALPDATQAIWQRVAAGIAGMVTAAPPGLIPGGYVGEKRSPCQSSEASAAWAAAFHILTALEQDYKSAHRNAVPDDEPVSTGLNGAGAPWRSALTHGHLRRLRTALSKTKPADFEGRSFPPSAVSEMLVRAIDYGFDLSSPSMNGRDNFINNMGIKKRDDYLLQREAAVESIISGGKGTLR